MALIRASGPRCAGGWRSRSVLVLLVLVFRSVAAAQGRDPAETTAEEASALVRPGKVCSVTGSQSGPWSLIVDRELSPGSLGIFRGSGQEGRGPWGLAAERSSNRINLVEEGRMAWAPSELGCISSRNRLALLARAGFRGRDESHTARARWQGRRFDEGTWPPGASGCRGRRDIRGMQPGGDSLLGPAPHDPLHRRPQPSRDLVDRPANEPPSGPAS